MKKSLCFKQRHRIVLVIPSAIILLVLTSCGLVKEITKGTQNSIGLKVVSFNILTKKKDVTGVQKWDDRSAFVYSLLYSTEADIIGLQEAVQKQHRYLDFWLSPRYDKLGVGRDNGINTGEYCSIFYLKDRFKVDQGGTFWFSNTPNIPSKPGPGDGWGNPKHKRICTWARFIEKSTGKAFYFYNLHLEPGSNENGIRPELTRWKSVKLLTQRIFNREHEDPFIVVGDFNAKPCSNEIKFLLKKSLSDDPAPPGSTELFTIVPMIDSWEEKHGLDCRSDDDSGTYHGGTGERDVRRIDYIFAQENAFVSTATIIHDTNDGHFPSDHFPIMSEVRLPLNHVD